MPHFYFLCACLFFAAGFLPGAEPVRVREDKRTYTLSNDAVTVVIDKAAGTVRSLKYDDMECLGGGGGYWSQSARTAEGVEIEGYGMKRAAKIVSSDADRVTVAITCQPTGTQGELPCAVELRYSLGREDSGLYAQAIWEHGPGMGGFGIGEARFALKLNPRVFNFLSIDEKRNEELPSGADWDAGTPLNLKEVRRITTGKFAGRVEHKYDYAAVLSETPAYGWSSTEKKIGFWIINPSDEYLAGGPTKVELTGHLDVNRGGQPTLLNMWHGSHYGGSRCEIKPNERWRRVIGPFLLHVNSGMDPQGLWKSARSKAATERSAWPYAWAGESVKRSQVSGVLAITNEQRSGKLHVGLVAPPYRGRREMVDWQQDSKSPQFWTLADAKGSFVIPKVLPGTYRLAAFADGILGEFSKDNIVVGEGGTVDLGKLEWQPQRFGKTLWEIGIADRTSAEFRHGDHYWRWGMNELYAKEFPQDVHFIIGKSDWKRDWNYVQPGRVAVDGKRVTPTTWKVTFTLAEAPVKNAVLRMGIAGSRLRWGLDVRVNSKKLPPVHLPDTGVMHRDGIRGLWVERQITIEPAQLKAGENTIEFRVNPSSWVDSVLYDYIRLEM